MQKTQSCELLELQYLLGNKWTFPLLFEIKAGHESFNALKKRTKNMVNPTLLSTTLQKLEKLEIVAKKENVYTLTKRGEGLLGHLSSLREWAEKNKLCVGKHCVKQSCMDCGFFI